MYRLKTAIIILILISTAPLYAADKGPPKGKGPPPAKVSVAKLSSGMIAPSSQYVGTVYFQEVSDIAAEVSGRVDSVNFEDGEVVKAGGRLVKINSSILAKSLQSTRATHAEVMANLEKAEIAFARTEKLYSRELVSASEYDEHRFGVKALRKRVASLKADVQRLKAELDKKSIKAPYGGVVIKRHVDRGEWLSPGTLVATIAKVDFVDIVVNVPERAVSFTKKDMTVNVEVAGREITGKVVAVIPRGDVATRTFPVKVRVRNDGSFIEGMEARVSLPVGKRAKALLIHRDALITVMGRVAVYTVKDSKAVMIPVEVIGYDRVDAGIRSKGLKAGMPIVVKGNERIRNGQGVIVLGKGKGKGRKAQ